MFLLTENNSWFCYETVGLNLKTLPNVKQSKNGLYAIDDKASIEEFDELCPKFNL